MQTSNLYLRIPFNAEQLGTAHAAIIDLTDPLRTNVKLSVPGGNMYADLVTIRTIAANGTDHTGTATHIRKAWLEALMDERPTQDGILHINLLRIPQSPGLPDFSMP